MKFSVIIPTFNEEKYIGKTLESLSKQAFKDFEVIISDISTDETKKVAESFNDRLNIRVITPKGKRGVAYQRNEGAKVANNEILLFIDADVTLRKNALKIINRSFSRGKYAFVSSASLPDSFLPIDHIAIGVWNVYSAIRGLFKPVFQGAFFAVKKEAFETVGRFQEDITFAEDFDLSMRLYDAGYRFKKHKRPLFKFSVRRFDQEGRLKFFFRMSYNGIISILPETWQKKLMWEYELEGYENGGREDREGV